MHLELIVYGSLLFGTIGLIATAAHRLPTTPRQSDGWQLLLPGLPASLSRLIALIRRQILAAAHALGGHTRANDIPPDRRGKAGQTTLLVPFLLACVLAAAAVVRILRSHFGLPYLLHYDEPQTASTALQMLKTGDFNPHFFNYGSLTIYLSLIVDVLHYFYLMAQKTGFNVLRSIGEIKTEADTHFHWTISHPTFYLWNRYLVAMLGTASVGITYYLAKWANGRWAGLAAAVILAFLPVHIEHSTYITTDVPGSFFALCTVLCALLFLNRGRPHYLLLALACGGLATSVKYNHAIVIIVPFAVLIYATLTRTEGYRWWLWVALPLVPPAAFFSGTPYALLNLPAFLSAAGHEIYHYKTMGHLGYGTVQPGLPHAVTQLGVMAAHLGLVVTACSIIGAAVIAARRLGWVLYLYPLVALVVLSGMNVAFHRNFIVFYPFLAIAAGCGVQALYHALTARFVQGRRRSTIVTAVAALGAVAIAGYWFVSAARSSYLFGATPETRSQAIDRANALLQPTQNRLARVGIAAELLMHQADLERLRFDYEILPYRDLACRYNTYALVIVPSRKEIGRPDLLAFPPEVTGQAQMIEPFMLSAALHHELISSAVPPPRPAAINDPTLFVPPDVWVLLPSKSAATPPIACAHMPTPPPLASSQPPSPPVQVSPSASFSLRLKPHQLGLTPQFAAHGDSLHMTSWGQVTTPAIHIPPGAYRFYWVASTRPECDTRPHVKAALVEHLPGSQTRILEERVIAIFGWDLELSTPFRTDHETEVALGLEFVNGSRPAGSVGECPVYLKTIAFERMAQPGLREIFRQLLAKPL